jgi:hypothetical protein
MARNQTQAASFLRDLPFELRQGTNWFGDDFCLLYWAAPLARYVEVAEWYENQTYRLAFSQIAGTIMEVGPYIRFIAVELNAKEGPSPVDTPSLQITTDVVERALRDAEQLLHTSGAVSGIDRVHTALHGYLKAACNKNTIPYPKDPSINVLFKLLRERHPAVRACRSRDSDIDRMLKSLSVVVDALNPLRNRSSMAHPTASLLEEAEAMLVINSVRTLLHYLNVKLG